jgi:hypothetical protein
VLQFQGVSKWQTKLWLCVCDCGNQGVRSTGSLTSGHSKSCGCLSAQMSKERFLKHGLCGNSKSYGSWQSMMNRCYNPHFSAYPYYGARGTRACEFLRSSPLNLIVLLGERPKGKTLDRINNDGHYTCGQCAECLKCGYILNVRWATHRQQSRNKSSNVHISIGGISKPLIEWAEESQINYWTLWSRVQRGWHGEKLLNPSHIK